MGSGQARSSRPANGDLKMQTVVRLVCVLFVVGVVACDEPFPPYAEPQGVLNGEVSVVVPDTVQVYFDAASQQYYLNSQMIFNVTVTNMHDDLLEGEALVSGVITAQSFSQIPRVVLIPLTTGNLLQPPVFQGNIAISPGGVASFSTLWIPYATDGEIVFKDLPFSTDGTDKFYGPVAFSASAEVQLFERVQPIVFGAAEFTLVFREIQVQN